MNNFKSARKAKQSLDIVRIASKKIYFIFVLLFIGEAVASQSNLRWNTQGKDFHDAIPLGNGDIGVSAWTEQSGQLKFYLSKTDAYDDNNRLLKLGLVTVRVSPNPFKPGEPFEQELNLKDGEMNIRAGSKDDELSLHLWVDANNPVVHVELKARKNFAVQVHLENWRTTEHIIRDTAFSDPFSNSIDNSMSTLPAIQYPDHILTNERGQLAWYHQNQKSCWANTLKLQGMEAFASTSVDPLQDRIFGAAILGEGLIKKNDTMLVSGKPARQQQISIIALTKRGSTPQQWLNTVNTEKEHILQQDILKVFAAHKMWWARFWNRSWIKIETAGDTTGATISRGYALQRWLAACGGRGKDWIKFNGSIFTLPWEKPDPDFRRWGSANWFQNVRLVYWPMIASGDFDMIAPFYGAYLDALPLARERTKKYYGHAGAFFSETSYAWGTYSNADYGYDRHDLPAGLATNTYIRYYWSGGLELSTMMLEQYAISKSQKFLSDTLLPLVSDVIEFYDQHWKEGKDGKIRFDPAQSLETWQQAVNPLPVIAGLDYILRRLLSLPANLLTEKRRNSWVHTLSRLPVLPVRIANDSTYLLPAQQFDKNSNVENPELYAVFPYRLFGIGRPRIQTAINSFAIRVNRESRCWWQDEIQAACLGLTNQAADGITRRMSNWNREFRFPAMWGPNNDEIPDLDHGGAGQIALQNMLLQSVGDSIFLFPAWPVSWNVNFKLYAPKGTVVEGLLVDGKLQKLEVTPKTRYQDIIVPATIEYKKNRMSLH